MTVESHGAAFRLPEGAVLLHIGPAGTGGSTLRASLLATRDELQAAGTHLVGGSGPAARAGRAVVAPSLPPGRVPPPTRHWESLVRDIGSAGARRVVVSSDPLALADADTIRRIADDIGAERVHVLITLRPLARIIPWAWQLGIQRGWTTDLDGWIQRLFPDGDEPATVPFWWLHRHDRLVERWATVLGADRVRVVVAHESVEAVAQALEQLLELSPGAMRVAPASPRRLLSSEEAQAIRALNAGMRTAGHESEPVAWAARRAAIASMLELDPPAGCSPIALPDRAREPIGRLAREMVSALRRSGALVSGDLDSLTWLPEPVDATAVTARGGSIGAPPQVAARLAMGLAIASGRTRRAGAPDDVRAVATLSRVTSRSLIDEIAIRARVAAIQRGRQGWRKVHGVRRRVSEPLRRLVRARTNGPRGLMPAILPPGSLILHIGPPKTGTTAVQGAFHACRDEAERMGLHYAGRSRHSISAIQAVLGRPGFRSDGPPDIAHWQRLRDEIRGSLAARVLLSSEFLADAKPEDIRRIVDDLGAERIQVVVTLRPLARILPSQWQQYVQSGNHTGFGPWLDAILNKPPGTVSPSFWHRHRDDELIARWAAVVGSERVTAIVVDETNREWVLRVFEDLVGLSEGTLRLQEELANRSLSMEETEAVRVLNTMFSDAGLKRPVHSAIVNFGATEYLKRLPPPEGTSRIELPGWTAPRVEELAADIAAGIRASGARIIGETERLTEVRTGRGPGPDGEVVLVPSTVAAALALGIMYATGLASSSAARTGANPGRWGSRLAAGRTAMLPVGTRTIMSELVARLRRRLTRIPGRH